MDAIEEAATYFSDRQDLLEGSKFLVAKARTLRALNRLDERAPSRSPHRPPIRDNTDRDTCRGLRDSRGVRRSDATRSKASGYRPKRSRFTSPDGQDDVARELSKVFLQATTKWRE